MKKLILINLSLLVILYSCSTGKISENRVTEFSNPILSGFYPDPSICRTDSNFYLVNSTFSYYPGIPVFQSKDLVNWRLIGYVLNRPEQLNLDNLGVSRGIFAPVFATTREHFM